MNDSSRTMRLAGVDLGTLTCRLLIADLQPCGRLIEVRSERRILRLGEGVDQTKRLSNAAMDRVIHCLKEWRDRRAGPRHRRRQHRVYLRPAWRKSGRALD